MACCTEKNGRILFSNGSLELAFDRLSARWLALRDLGTGDELLSHGAQQASLVISVNGVTTATRELRQCASVVDAEQVGTKAVCTGYHCEESEAGLTLTLRSEEGDWAIDQMYTLAKAQARIERGVRVQYRGQGTALLRGLEFRVPPANPGPIADCFVEVPGYPTKAHQPVASIPLGDYWDRVRGEAPGTRPGLICLDNPSQDLTIAAWAFSSTEPASLRLRRGDHGTQVAHTVLVCDRFMPGHSVEWRAQYVQIAHQPWREFLAQFQDWYNEINMHAVNVPEWARSARIYELFIGESPQRATKFPDCDTLIEDLPRIQDLGFDTVQIMPHMPLPSYSVIDYYDVDTHYGSAEGLKRLSARAHQLGMRILLDVVLHGVMDREAVEGIKSVRGHSWPNPERLPRRHPYREEHPEWFMKTEFNTPAATYTWAFDHANEGWRDFMVNVFKYYMEEYDVDGFRVDALTWNHFPNWAEGLPYRASEPLYASASLMEQVRQEIQQIKSDAVLYTESTGPLYAHSCDLAYNYDEQWVFSGLVTPISPRGFAYTLASATEKIDARDLGLWLTQRRLAKQRGAVTVHHLDSHDSHEWGRLFQYRREAFGEEASRALFALCCALDGGIMVYQGAEDTAEDYYRKLLHLKRDLPALRQGSCDCEAIEVDDRRVFAPLRVHGTQLVVPVINVSHQNTRVSLHLPLGQIPLIEKAYRVIDRMDDTVLPGPDGVLWTLGQLHTIALDLEPYQVQVLELIPAES